MRLPDIASQKLGIDPEAEYGALLRMPPLRLARILHRLSIRRTRTVLISIMNNEGVSFIKERPDSNLDQGSDSSSGEDLEIIVTDDDEYKFEISCSNNGDDVQDHEEATTIEIVNAQPLYKPLCMTCLHKYINFITWKFPEASQVTMYLGRDVPTVIEYRVPGRDFTGYRLPLANHRYHRKRERSRVRNAGLWEGDEREMDPEDVEENGDDEEDENDDEDDDDDDEDDDEDRKRKREDGDEEQENEVDAEDGGGERENKGRRLNPEYGDEIHSEDDDETDPENRDDAEQR